MLAPLPVPAASWKFSSDPGPWGWLQLALSRKRPEQGTSVGRREPKSLCCSSGQAQPQHPSALCTSRGRRGRPSGPSQCAPHSGAGATEPASHLPTPLLPRLAVSLRGPSGAHVLAALLAWLYSKPRVRSHQRVHPKSLLRPQDALDPLPGQGVRHHAPRVGSRPSARPCPAACPAGQSRALIVCRSSCPGRPSSALALAEG